MKDERHAYICLDNLLAGLEEGILALDDKELNVNSMQLFGNVGDVQATIATGMRVGMLAKGLPDNHEVGIAFRGKNGSKQIVPSIKAPSSFADKRELLAAVLAEQTSVPGEMRLAFGARSPLSDSEVDSMVERLIHLGLLRREDIQGKE